MDRVRANLSRLPGGVEAALPWCLYGAWLLSLALAGIIDGDLWFHLAGGRYTVAHGHPPFTDTFSYPSAGREYVCIQWLFQVGLYLAYRLAGDAGLVAAKAALVLGVAAAVVAACGLRTPSIRARRRSVPGLCPEPCRGVCDSPAPSRQGARKCEPVVAGDQCPAVGTAPASAPPRGEARRVDHPPAEVGRQSLRCLPVWPVGPADGGAAAAGRAWPDGGLLILMLVTLAGSATFTLRPTLVTLILLGLFLAVWRQDRGFWRFPVLQVVWVNSQGLFILGPFVVGCWALADLRRRLRYAVLTGLACLLNPYGLHGALFPFVLVTRLADRNVYSRNILELTSAVDGHFFLSHPAGWAALALLAGCLVAFGCAWHRGERRALLPYGLLLAGFVYLYVQAFRNLPLAALVAAWLVCRLAPGLTTWSAARPLVRWGAVAVLLLLPLGLRLRQAQAGFPAAVRGHAPVPAFARLAPYTVPAAAADFLQETAWRGRPFNDFNWGGYLMWRLGPEVPVFIDPRLEVHSQAFFEQYLRLTRDATAFADLDRTYAFDAAVFCHVPCRGLPDLLAYLLTQPEWRLAYADETAAVFRRRPAVEAGTPAPPPRLVLPPVDPNLAGLTERYRTGAVTPRAAWSRPAVDAVYGQVGAGHLRLALGQTEAGLSQLLQAAICEPRIGDLHLFVAYAALRVGDRALFDTACGYLRIVQPHHPELPRLRQLAAAGG